MATYFHVNSEIQAADGTMQTLYLMNPNYVPYSDTTSLPNNALLLSHAPPSNDDDHPLIGIPLPAPSTNITQTSSEDINNRSSSLQALVPGAHYDLWSSSMYQNSAQNHTQMASLAVAAPGNSTQLGLPRPVASTSCRQGLSLSLSSQQPAYSRPINVGCDTQARGQVTVLSTGDFMRVSESSPSSISVVSNGISSIQSVILGSKYLKATQELLDEVVKVGDVINTDATEEIKVKMKLNKEPNMATIGEEAYVSAEISANRQAAELTTAQKQELQIKKAKLVNMLDEVEQRYKQYHHQMQSVVFAFEQAAGFGSAKSYTSLALRTISKQFRCLKDVISAQIKATSKKLGEDEGVGVKVEGSRLRFVDHQLRQQRALQQLGMMQHNAWRPQRGLPERAVTILRAWLFEHFLHPYPKDSDKQMLAKQTGLTRSQVSNWFINARVRLWKPMVEDMYLEEMKDQERNGSENASKTESKDSTKSEQVKILQAKAEKPTNQIASPTEFSNSTISTSLMGGSHQPQTGFNLVGPSDHVEGAFHRIRQKKPRNAEMQHSPSSMLSIDMDLKQGETSRDIGGKFFGREMLNKDGYPQITSISEHVGGFGAYSMGANIGRFNPDHLQLAAPRFHSNSNGVSLTLGLPHCENLPISGAQQNLLSSHNIQLGRGLELGSGEADFCCIDTPQPSHSSTGGYASIDIQTRKRFAAQLLPENVT